MKNQREKELDEMEENRRLLYLELNRSRDRKERLMILKRINSLTHDMYIAFQEIQMGCK